MSKSKLKVGIITLDDLTNYGNRLQNYAMQELLLEIGVDPLSIHTIPFEDWRDIRKESFPLYVKMKLYRLKLLRTVWRKVNGKDKHTSIRDTSSKKSLIDNKKRSFSEFNNKYLNYFEDGIFQDPAPKTINKYFDYFVTGSDQVWNPLFTSWSKYVMYLRFAPKQKRIALSASFGIETIPECYKKILKKYISGMSYISVREDSGKKIVEQLVNKSCTVIPDPTLLIEIKKWKNMADEAKLDLPEKYILTYFLGEKCDDYYEYMKKINSDQSIQIISMNDISQEAVYTWSPDQFIAAIKGSSLFLTDSFHGMVFAIRFHKQVVIFRRKSKEDMFGRIESILKDINLKKIIYKNSFNDDLFITEDEFRLTDLYFEEKHSIVLKMLNEVFRK